MWPACCCFVVTTVVAAVDMVTENKNRPRDLKTFKFTGIYFHTLQVCPRYSEVMLKSVPLYCMYSAGTVCLYSITMNTVVMVYSTRCSNIHLASNQRQYMASTVKSVAKLTVLMYCTCQVNHSLLSNLWVTIKPKIGPRASAVGQRL